MIGCYEILAPASSLNNPYQSSFTPDLQFSLPYFAKFSDQSQKFPHVLDFKKKPLQKYFKICALVKGFV